MLSPDYLRDCADRMQQLASEIEEAVIASIIEALIKRLLRDESLYFTARDAWQIQTLEEAGILLKDIQKILAAGTGYGVKEIRRAMAEAGIQAIKTDTEILAGKEAPTEGTKPGGGKNTPTEGTKTGDTGSASGSGSKGTELETRKEKQPEKKQPEKKPEKKPDRKSEPEEGTEPVGPSGTTTGESFVLGKDSDVDTYFPGMSEPTEELTGRSPYFVRLTQRAEEATEGTWRNLTKTVAYNSIESFVKACDKAYTMVTSGAQSLTQAIQEAVQELVKEGVTTVTNPDTGHTDYVDVAAARAIRTGVSQMAAELAIERAKELGLDLLLVSAHLGARPSHEVWQGKVYSMSGTSEKYANFYEATGYGTGEGLCGWNCRHSVSPFVEGMTNPYEENPVDSDDNKKRYAVEQKAREYERRIRKIKRILAGLNAALRDTSGMPEDLRNNLEMQRTNAKADLKRTEDRYYEFCAENDLRPLEERLRVEEAGL